jgi:hypothetical protein
MSFRVESRTNESDKEYTSSVVCESEEEAETLLAEFQSGRPGSHKVVKPKGSTSSSESDSNKESTGRAKKKSSSSSKGGNK